MSNITYRVAREQDLGSTYQVFVTATNHLAAAHNFAQQAENKAPPNRALAFRHHALKHDPERFWVAEDAKTIVAFGVSQLREDLCYLAALHVLPGYQGHGIGRRLLQLCMGKDQAPGARVWTTIADSLNPVSNGLYAHFGMYQWVPLMPLAGMVSGGRINWDKSHHQPASLSASNELQLEALAQVDKHVLNLRREIDHQLWLAQPDLTAYLFGEPSNPRGYAYLSASGAIGPVAVKNKSDWIEILAFCLASLKDRRVEIKVPGLCHEGLRYLLGRGLRFGRPLLILASEPFARMDLYIPSGSDALL